MDMPGIVKRPIIMSQVMTEQPLIASYCMCVGLSRFLQAQCLMFALENVEAYPIADRGWRTERFHIGLSERMAI